MLINLKFPDCKGKGVKKSDKFKAITKNAIIAALSKKSKKIKILKCPNHGMVGKKNRLGHKDKDGIRSGSKNPKAKKVKCIELDLEFDTMIDASEFFNVNKNSISLAARKGSKIRRKYTIVYVNKGVICQR